MPETLVHYANPLGFTIIRFAQPVVCKFSNKYYARGRTSASIKTVN